MMDDFGQGFIVGIGSMIVGMVVIHLLATL